MYFTRDDFIKIENWLKANSVKDTDFSPAILPLDGNEQIPIVLKGLNRLLSVSRFILPFTLITENDFNNLLMTGGVDKNMIYGIFTDSKGEVKKIYFGTIPFGDTGISRRLKNVSDWSIDTNFDNIQNISASRSVVEGKFKASRTITYEWSDGRPDTQEIEYGVILLSSTVSKDIFNIQGLDGIYTFTFSDNIGTSILAREIPLNVQIYSPVEKEISLNMDYTFTLDFIFINTNYIITKSFEEQDFSIELTVASSRNTIVFDTKNVTKDVDIIKGVTVVPQTPVTSIYNKYIINVSLYENTSLEERTATLTLHSTNGKLDIVYTIKLLARTNVKISGMSFNNILAYEDSNFALSLPDTITITKGLDFIFYLKPAEGYALPISLGLNIIQPSTAISGMQYDRSTGKVTFKNVVLDITYLGINGVQVLGYSYGEVIVNKFNYDEWGSGEEGQTSRLNEFEYKVQRTTRYTDGTSSVDTINYGGTETFSFIATISPDRIIDENENPTCSIANDGTITWHINDLLKVKNVKVTVKVLFVDSDGTEHYGTKDYTIKQRIPMREVTLKGINATLNFATGFASLIPYGGNVKIAVSTLGNYTVPSQEDYSKNLKITPVNGYNSIDYTVNSTTSAIIEIKGVVSNISVDFSAEAETEVTTPVYIGVLTPEFTGFNSKASAVVTAITPQMIESAINGQALKEIEVPVPKVVAQAKKVTVSTKYSYVMVLVPQLGKNAGYSVTEYDGITPNINGAGFNPFDIGDPDRLVNDGSKVININNENFCIFTKYMSVRPTDTPLDSIIAITK